MFSRVSDKCVLKMNMTSSILERQYGNSFWKEYDTAIKRLHCLRINDYQGISYHVNNLNINEDSPILACKFSRTSGYEHLVALANEDGKFAIYNTHSQGSFMIHNIVAHHNAIFDIEWLSNDTKIITASGDYTVRLWNITESAILSEKIYLGHSRSVKTVTSNYTDPSIFASGARDGIIMIWDRRSHVGSDLIPKPDNIIKYCYKPSTPGSHSKQKHMTGNSITGLVFQDERTLISCTACDGVINVWDTRKSYSVLKRTPLPKYTLPYAGSTLRNGFTHLLMDPNSMKLYASCLDNIIYCYNVSTYNPTPIIQYSGHQIQNSFYIKSSLSPDGMYLISGSADDKAYIWNVKKQYPLVSLTSHTAEVSCVAWNQKGDLKIVTCSEDSKHKVWEVGPEFIVDDDSKVTGHAEVIEKGHGDANRFLTTPRFCKRISYSSRTTPTFGCSAEKRRCIVCPLCLNRTPGSACGNCKSNSDVGDLSGSNNILKRKMNDSSLGESSKKARRLFSPNKELIEPEFNILASRLEPTNDSASTSNLDLNRSYDQTSNFYMSPTTNLPNFVIDGTAPHLRNISPQKKHSNNNWLLKIRKEKEFMQSITENIESSASKIMKLDIDSTERSPKVSKKNNSKKSPSRTPKSSNSIRSQSPLLKFFKVTPTFQK